MAIMCRLSFSLVLLSLLTRGILSAPVDNNTESCGVDFQRKFQELKSLRETCKDAVLKDCCEIANGIHMFGGVSGTTPVYTIRDICAKDRTFRNVPEASATTIQARCDTKDGWLIILKRNASASPLVNFRRTWVEYENGFGDLNTEFWYGLKNIHCLTKRDDVELMIELRKDNGTGIVWTYQEFSIDGPDNNYALHIGGHRRIEGYNHDQMNRINGYPFSTIDNDNDDSGHNCAAKEAHNYGAGGGWWYRSCAYTVLTRPHTGPYRIYWGYHNAPTGEYFPHVEMKIRPKSCLMAPYEEANSCDPE